MKGSFVCSGSILLTFLALCVTAKAAPPLCSTAKLQELTAATAGSDVVSMDCDVRLSAGQTVTKQIAFIGAGASGLTFDCNGQTIDGDARSMNARGQAMVRVVPAPILDPQTGKCLTDSEGFCRYSAPNGVTVKNCNIKGRARVDSTFPPVAASHYPSHVSRLRAMTPKRTTFDNNTFLFNGDEVVLYVFGGAEDTTIRNNVFNGNYGIALYLDPESFGSVVVRNNFLPMRVNSPSVSYAEIIRVDGSEYNVISGNTFLRPDHGGIALFRNCGESGGVRYTTPAGNAIYNNNFIYEHGAGNVDPAVFLGSRNWGDTQSFCERDSPLYFPSSGIRTSSEYDNKDHARDNVVADNRIFNIPADGLVRVGRATTDSNNVIYNNITATSADYRKSGCLTSTSFAHWNLWDGATAFAMEGAPAQCQQQICRDGVIESQGSCSPSEVSFDCAAADTNAGCSKRVYCPAGKSMIAATAVCNLETTAMSSTELGKTMGNHIRVVTPSDNIDSGRCAVGNVVTSAFEAVSQGLIGTTPIVVSCQEHDDNGGDCRIQGKLYCM